MSNTAQQPTEAAENKQEQRSLTFNDDGSIDPEQLVGMPQELIDRVTDPEFQARARQYIAAEKSRASFHAGARQIRDAAQAMHAARRPAGVSGRQRKRLRKLARLAARIQAPR
jgi:hypothetical protein